MSINEQGKLFQPEAHWASTEPANSSTTDYIMEPSFTNTVGQEQQITVPYAPFNHDDNMLDTLKEVVRGVSAANTRGGFPQADESAIRASARRRRMTDSQAVQRAVRNGTDIRQHAQDQYDKLAMRAQAGLGLLSVMGVDTSSLGVPSFHEFSEKTSGVEHRNQRRRLYASEHWKNEFNQLVTKRAGISPEASSNVETHEEVDQATEFDHLPVIYTRYAARFSTLKGKNGDTTDESFEIFNKLIVRNNGFPKGALLPPKLDRAFVLNPSAYKASLRYKGKDYVPEEEFRSNLGEKIVYENIILTELANELELLDEVGQVVLGEKSDISYSASILKKAMELFEKEIETIAKSESWDENLLSEEIEKLHDHLFPGSKGKSTLKSRWFLVLQQVKTHIGEQKRLFEWNVSELSKDLK